MPYVASDDAANALSVDLRELRAMQGPPPWRVPLSASPLLRSVVLCLPSGARLPAHRHPRAVEVFVILDGEAEFTFNADDVRRGTPGTQLYAPVGVPHAIRAVGDQPLLFLISLAPNELDDTEELEAP